MIRARTTLLSVKQGAVQIRPVGAGSGAGTGGWTTTRPTFPRTVTGVTDNRLRRGVALENTAVRGDGAPASVLYPSRVDAAPTPRPVTRSPTQHA